MVRRADIAKLTATIPPSTWTDPASRQSQSAPGRVPVRCDRKVEAKKKPPRGGFFWIGALRARILGRGPRALGGRTSRIILQVRSAREETPANGMLNTTRTSMITGNPHIADCGSPTGQNGKVAYGVPNDWSCGPVQPFDPCSRKSLQPHGSKPRRLAASAVPPLGPFLDLGKSCKPSWESLAMVDTH